MTHGGPVMLALLVLGCSHAEPFAVADPVQEVPFAPGEVVRLTYGQGVSAAGWLPAGDTLVLAQNDPDQRVGDICLYLLPAGGGTHRGGFCSSSHQQADSLETFGNPAVSDNGTIAVTYRHQRLGGSTFGVIRTGPLALPFTATDVSSLPFSLNGRVFQNATDFAWQPDGSLAFLAWTDEVWEKLCAGLPCDELVRIPYGAVRLPPGAGGGATAVTGTYLATSITPDGAGGLFVTYPASDQLWRISAAGDSVAVHDFGPGSMVRDADYRAGKVAVILGGTQSIAADDIGVMQVQPGAGAVAILDLASGTVAVVSPPDMFFHDPALSPDGRHVVALGGFISQGESLWRINIP